jgi:hypothetical protein
MIRTSQNLDLFSNKYKIAEQTEKKQELDDLINSINTLRTNYTNILREKDIATTFAFKCYNETQNCINAARTRQDPNTIKCFNEQHKCLNDAALRQTKYLDQKNNSLKQLEDKFNELSAKVSELDYTIRITPLPTSISSPYSHLANIKSFPGVARKTQSAPATLTTIGSPQQLPGLGVDEDIPSTSPDYQYGVIPNLHNFMYTPHSSVQYSDSSRPQSTFFNPDAPNAFPLQLPTSDDEQKQLAAFSKDIPMDGGRRKCSRKPKCKISKRKIYKRK